MVIKQTKDKATEAGDSVLLCDCVCVQAPKVGVVSRHGASVIWAWLSATWARKRRLPKASSSRCRASETLVTSFADCQCVCVFAW